MSKARRWRGILILGALAVFAGPALAQDVVDEPRYAPSLTGESGGWDLLSGKTVPQGQWSFGLYYNNVDRVFEFNDEADADWHSLRVSLGYGLSESFELSLMLPYDDIDADIPGGGDPLGSGLGNARLGAKWRVTGTPDSDTSLAINAFAELPTKRDDVCGVPSGHFQRDDVAVAEHHEHHRSQGGRGRIAPRVRPDGRQAEACGLGHSRQRGESVAAEVDTLAASENDDHGSDQHDNEREPRAAPRQRAPSCW